MTQAALLRLVRKARKTALFRWRNGAGWEVCPLPPRETLYIERDDRGFDFRGREDDEDGIDVRFMRVQEAAKHLRGDEVVRLQCWGTGNISERESRGNTELLDIWHLDLVTGEKIEVAPNDRGDGGPIGNPTTTGILP